MKTLSMKSTDHLWPWIGQSRLGLAFFTMIDQGQWPATVMFTGPAHLGKGTIAIWLAQRDLCRQTRQRPCGTCQDCQLVTTGAHPDCIVLNAGVSERLKTDAVKEAVAPLNWKRESTLTNRRWVIFRDVDQLSEHVANTLLKLIEEPPPGTTVVLTSSQPERVLPTLRSRTVQYRWQAVPVGELDVALHIRFPNLPIPSRRQIVTQAHGRPGVAMRLAARPQWLEEEWASVNDCLAAIQQRHLPARQEVTSTDLDRYEITVRDLVLSLVTTGPRTWSDHQPELRQQAAGIGWSRLLEMADQLSRRHLSLVQNVQPSFFLHDLLV